MARMAVRLQAQAARLAIVFVASSWATVSSGQWDIVSGKPPEFDDFGYLVRGAAWEFSPGDEKVIFVCWENPNEDNAQARAWAQEQIEITWQRHSAIVFRGWERCAENNSGIRIIWRDSGPKVENFGRTINGVPNGMVLNHRLDKWKPACPFSLEQCIRFIAVHEFGHALGFAHEQNRPDRDGECADQEQQDQEHEIILTPYDSMSVMNYCNDRNATGLLSVLDIYAVQQIYGAPTP